MTDDLVKRLRLYAYCDDWINEERREAADEIEQLRACCKSMKQLLDAAEIVDPNL